MDRFPKAVLELPRVSQMGCSPLEKQTNKKTKLGMD